MRVEAAALVQFGSQAIEARLVTLEQRPAFRGIDGRRGHQFAPFGSGHFEDDSQGNTERSDGVGVVVGEQPLGLDLPQPADGVRSSIDQGAPCSVSSGRKGSAENASGPLTPSPFHSPVANSSRAIAGCTAVCHTTA